MGYRAIKIRFGRGIRLKRASAWRSSLATTRLPLPGRYMNIIKSRPLSAASSLASLPPYLHRLRRLIIVSHDDVSSLSSEIYIKVAPYFLGQVVFTLDKHYRAKFRRLFIHWDFLYRGCRIFAGENLQFLLIRCQPGRQRIEDEGNFLYPFFHFPKTNDIIRIRALVVCKSLSARLILDERPA